MNYYEHHLGDYYRKAKHLTLLEHGAYRMLHFSPDKKVSWLLGRMCR